MARQHRQDSRSLKAWRKWLRPGIGIKRWIALLALSVVALSLALALLTLAFLRTTDLLALGDVPLLSLSIISGALGCVALYIGTVRLSRSVLSALLQGRRKQLIDLMTDHMQQANGLRLVALGGGSGLPSVLRAFKGQTSNITAIVTVADDGGSTGILREEFGVLAPGDLRQNIAALADDESLITQLFQYRFTTGGLQGHSFGNLFLTALADITGSMDRAVIEASQVLAIRGRVLPATLQNVQLGAEVRTAERRLRRVIGESRIPKEGGTIERVFLVPESARAYPDSIRAILSAELIVIGPGSLFTSILPTLLVDGIVQAVRASNALVIYVCNIATQKGETEGFGVAEHVLALERHIGQGVFDVILANNAYPQQNAGENTHYVAPLPLDHPLRYRYDLIETDLTDPQRPWRHSPEKLQRAIRNLLAERALHAEIIRDT
ncbi:MAG: YvcK family protein [Anaerolineae bacterium]|nr:YvcK family protein [Anaerolineae bacterium]